MCWISHSFFMYCALGAVFLGAAEKFVHSGPVLSSTAIIEVINAEGPLQREGIVLIKRGKEPFGIALPGGRVESGETVQDAACREVLEEVNIELMKNLVQEFHVYSTPGRDPRHHTVEVVHQAYTTNRSPKAGDDAEQAFVVPWRDIPWGDLAFDHAHVLVDFLGYQLLLENTSDTRFFWVLMGGCKSIYQKVFCLTAILGMDGFQPSQQDRLDAMFQAAICEATLENNEQHAAILLDLRSYFNDSFEKEEFDFAELYEKLYEIDADSFYMIFLFLELRSKSRVSLS